MTEPQPEQPEAAPAEAPVAEALAAPEEITCIGVF